MCSRRAARQKHISILPTGRRTKLNSTLYRNTADELHGGMPSNFERRIKMWHRTSCFDVFLTFSYTLIFDVLKLVFFIAVRQMTVIIVKAARN
jgi:hypothetical protein